MEQKLGNIARARQLYDASTVADPKHAAAWHGWGLLEKQQDNVLRARDLWLKARYMATRSTFRRCFTRLEPTGFRPPKRSANHGNLAHCFSFVLGNSTARGEGLLENPL